jgi:hypothetical protein
MKLGTLIGSLVILGTACAAVPEEASEGSLEAAETLKREEPRAPCLDSADCRAISSYCDGCQCLPAGALDPDPVCRAPMVACFADPCHHQHSECVRGLCALVPNGLAVD